MAAVNSSVSDDTAALTFARKQESLGYYYYYAYSIKLFFQNFKFMHSQ